MNDRRDVLVVDDDPDIVRFVQMNLEDEGKDLSPLFQLIVDKVPPAPGTRRS